MKSLYFFFKLMAQKLGFCFAKQPEQFGLYLLLTVNRRKVHTCGVCIHSHSQQYTRWWYVLNVRSCFQVLTMFSLEPLPLAFYLDKK